MHTVLIAAQSLDGFITRHDVPGTHFTSTGEKAWFAEALAGFDCTVLGGETYRVSRDFLRARLTADRLRMVVTRAPDAYAADAVPGQLEFSREEPSALLRSLEERGRHRCAMLGGSQMHRWFLRGGLVDELWVSVEPRLFGSGTPFLAGPAEVDLELLSHEALPGGSLLLKYAVRR